MGLWCQCFSVVLFLLFVEQGWAGCAGGSASPGDVSISIAHAALPLPRLRLSSNQFAGTATLLVSWLSPNTGRAPICGTDQSNTCLGPVSVLAPCSKQRVEVCAGFLLMRLRMSFSRDVSPWKLNLQSSVLLHPSSSLTSCALKLFCQSSNTFVSTLPSGQVASQKHSRRAAGGRICSRVTVRCARNGIARNCVVCLINGDNAVVSFSLQREIVKSRLHVIKGKEES